MSAFRQGIAAADTKIQRLNESSATARFRAGGWTCKEILGHLIDSALNNHQRFVRAGLEGHYQGPFYEQDGWVALHGYSALAWPDLLSQWRRQNELLCEVVDRIPHEKLNSLCKVGTDEPVTLEFLITDYLRHVHHHVDQIAQVADGPGALFIGYSVQKMEQALSQVKACAAQLSEEQLWGRSGENANAVGNLVLHLTGNIRQWIGHGVDGQPDIRERDKEFSARGGLSTAEILQRFEATVLEAISTLKSLSLSRLTDRINPQNRDVAVLEAIYQVVGHLQLHTGQIIFATKHLTGHDLGFFKPSPNKP